MELLKLDNLERVLKEYAVEVRNLYQDKLILNDRLASGDLLNSCEAYVEANGTTYEVKMTLANYWRYVEMDTEPHWPNVQDLMRWVEMKPVIPRSDEMRRLPRPTQIKQLAYLIGRKIAVFGTEGTPVLTESVEEMNAKYKEKMREALAMDVGGYLRLITSDF